MSMCLSLRPISDLLGNFSAWQQSFWERLSTERHLTHLLNFELVCTLALRHTSTPTHTVTKICKHSRKSGLWLYAFHTRHTLYELTI